jgi:NADH pyrophosphatase NudC (nudix superfamily)
MDNKQKDALIEKAPVTQQPMTMTTEQLMEVIREIKKPQGPTDAELKQIANQQEMRKQTAAQQAEIVAAKRLQQTMCSHKRRDGTCRAVYVKQGHYLLCQKCQAVIRPGTAPKSNAINAIYDTAMFNKLFQETATSNIGD